MDNYQKIDKRNVFLKGKSISLCALSITDIENSNWYGWFNDEHICIFTQKHYFPNSINKQIKFLNEIEGKNNLIVLGIVHDDMLVGVCSLNDINFINRNCSISIFIGEKIKDENVSLETFYLLLKHAFYCLNLNKVSMGQHIKLKLFFTRLSLAFGFINEGVSRAEIFKNGKYFDVINSSVLKNEFDEKIKDPNNSLIKAFK